MRCSMVLVLAVCPIEVSSQTSRADFSKFTHNNPNHSRLPCLLCHRRETNEPRPVRPGAADHAPCAGCHAKEFANSGHQICSVCHTDAQAGTVKPFPRLSSFGTRFDHARHQKTGCASCHRPSRGGVALSIPTGFNAHTNCFGCHTPRAQSNGRDISSCGACHQLGRSGRASTAAPAFRVGFSHAKHDRSEGLNCNECHRIQAARTQVSSPQPLNHHAAPRAFSCMSCHNGKRAFGGDDFSVCKRCHTGTRWRF